MFCHACGSQIVTDAVFCAACGTKQNQIKEVKEIKAVSQEVASKEHLHYEIIAYARTPSFGRQEINTTVAIAENDVTVTTHFHGKILLKTKPRIATFKISEIASVSYGYGTITYFLDILRYLIAIMMVLTNHFGYGLMALAFFAFITVSGAITIKLKNGSAVVIYFDKKHHTAEFFNCLISRIS